MNSQALIDSLVRQMTVLLAQVATAGGVRAPLANLADQVFVQLARELREQGISRKVSADMFRLALRTYARKLHRLEQAQPELRATLWQAVLEFVVAQQLVSRSRILERFKNDDPLQLSSVLHDLLSSLPRHPLESERLPREHRELQLNLPHGSNLSQSCPPQSRLKMVQPRFSFCGVPRMCRELAPARVVAPG